MSRSRNFCFLFLVNLFSYLSASIPLSDPKSSSTAGISWPNPYRLGGLPFSAFENLLREAHNRTSARYPGAQPLWIESHFGNYTQAPTIDTFESQWHVNDSFILVSKDPRSPGTDWNIYGWDSHERPDPPPFDLSSLRTLTMATAYRLARQEAPQLNFTQFGIKRNRAGRLQYKFREFESERWVFGRCLVTFDVPPVVSCYGGPESASLPNTAPYGSSGDD